MALLNTYRGAVRAVLGPTNTGKTHLAIDRMLAHATGMIGFPLRLLARENYDRIVAEKGRPTVALITGEEKIIPPNPQWWVCTVESMPMDRVVDFLAVDEIQLCADPDRGHIFTDRLLHARGVEETMFLGAETIATLMKHLVPDAQIESRPRFSTLKHEGQSKLTRLPRRSATVAFSVAEVYELAEQIRRHRGGAAVVLGALSPRTRNAQVEMYQAGEVDYLVATDAIGMGLNMDIDHVAFAGTRKFDGHRLRRLEPNELGQIAGRAGRHTNDGYFGVTNNIPPLDDEIVGAIENHRYRPVSKLYWRNRKLEFTSPKALLSSLRWEPPNALLTRMRDGDDHKVLSMLAQDEAVITRATERDRVQLLWDVCQTPDFRHVSPDDHAELVGQIFIKLIDHNGQLPDLWIEEQFHRLDRLDGDIDTITNRIAHIRTLAYIAHHGAWLKNAASWQAKGRDIEDRLSDALHERLIQRFVDKRASVLNRLPGEEGEPLGGLRVNGEVVLEGHVIGHMQGFQFVAHDAADARETRTLSATAERLVAPGLPDLVQRFEQAADETLSLETDGRILWEGAPIARLTRGAEIWRPGFRVLRGLTSNDTGLSQRIEVRIRQWLDQHLTHRLNPLFRLRDQEFSGSARGLVYRLLEGLGSSLEDQVKTLLNEIADEDRKRMTESSVRFGVHGIYLDHLLKPGPLRLRAALTAIWTGQEAPRPAKRGACIITLPKDFDTGALVLPQLGFVAAGPVALRMDRYEAVMAQIRRRAKSGDLCADAALAKIAGCLPEQADPMLRALGCIPVKGSETGAFRIKPKRTGPSDTASKPGKTERSKRKAAHRQKESAGRIAKEFVNSPFAGLKDRLAARSAELAEGTKIS